VSVRDDVELRVVDDPAGEAAEWLVRVAEAGGQIALSGGTTPQAAYERAAALGGDWSRAVLWFGDERCVPPDHEHSNYRMAREALLRHLDPAPEVHRMQGELGPRAGADAYERQLRVAAGGGVPQLDLALMGLGPDAHTASLFPDQPALQERRRLCVGVGEAGLAPYVARVTMTLPLFNAAREVVFLVAGADKAEAMARAFAGPPTPAAPASLVRPGSGRLVVLSDAAAAARL
jgi:6-phosphogluconolactonase